MSYVPRRGGIVTESLAESEAKALFRAGHFNQGMGESPPGGGDRLYGLPLRQHRKKGQFMIYISYRYDKLMCKCFLKYKRQPEFYR